MKTKIAVAMVVALIAGSAHAIEHKFEFSAAYNWGQVIEGSNAVTYTRVGVVAGSWQWRFADGKRGNTHFLAQSLYRSNPNLLVGTITFNMFEFERSAPGTDELYMSYEAITFDQDSGSVTVKGRILGGKGKYAGASGDAIWTSVNGFIESGKGTLILPDPPLRE